MAFLKRPSLALLATVIIALIAYGPGLQAEAAPIDRLLALIPSSSSSQQQPADDSPLQPLPQPSLGRAQIKPIGQRPPRPSDHHSRTRPSSPDDSSATAWYLLHQAQQRQQMQQLKMQYILSVRVQQQTQTQQQQQQRPPQYLSSETWSDRTLGGHAVLDDDDDDAGNELLDTESDELLRPDADDTIEGEVLEEEEDEDENENENDVEYEDDSEDDDVAVGGGDVYKP
ncbi:hypothetical protein BGX29_009745 [Mortierella sp. GBA35]|nr:hypothetical protein BGX29_009745 [Mortierella sp. GBA35]